MSLAAFHIQVADAAGNVVPSAHVEIRREIPGQPLASVFTDRDGVSGAGNPFDVDAVTGYKTVYLVGGAYQVRVYTGASGAPTFEAPLRRYVAIGLNSESDSIAQRTQVTIVAAGTYTMSPDDPDDILINKTVAAANTVALCDPTLRTKPVKIIDGKGDANTNNILITVPSGKTLFGILNGTTTIDSNGGSVVLSPLSGGTGWY